MPGQDNSFVSFDKYISYPIAEYIVPYLHDNGLKPNDVTFINIIFRLFILNDYNNNNCLERLILLSIISHIIDCFDGYMARKYNQCSTFGAKLDMYGDLVFWVLFGYLVYLKTENNNILYLLQIIIIIIIIYIFNKKEIDKKNIINTSLIEMNVPIILLLLYFFYHKKYSI